MFLKIIVRMVQWTTVIAILHLFVPSSLNKFEKGIYPTII